MEVEILVAEVGPQPGDDQLFHILYDGTVMDEDRFTVLGGEAEAIEPRVEAGFREGLDLAEAVRLAASALAGPDRTLAAGELEAAVLAAAAPRAAGGASAASSRATGGTVALLAVVPEPVVEAAKRSSLQDDR